MSLNSFTGICYQINVESFADGNGDGLGDFSGIINKLDYLDDLGVKNIILLPIHPSTDYSGNKLYHKYAPDNYNLVDNLISSKLVNKIVKSKVRTYSGFVSKKKKVLNLQYDKNIMSKLINTVHSKNMKLIMDLVVVHSSTRHPWFKAAINSKNSKSIQDKYQKYYYFQDNQDTTYKFKTPVISGLNTITKYYRSAFDSADQPYLNWNNPEVYNNFVNICKYWISLGVDGFRIDATSYMLDDKSENVRILERLETDVKKIKKDIIFINESNWELTAKNIIEPKSDSYYDQDANYYIKNFNLDNFNNINTKSIPLNYTNTHDTYTGLRIYLKNKSLNTKNEFSTSIIPSLLSGMTNRIEIDISKISDSYQNIKSYSLYIWSRKSTFSLKSFPNNDITWEQSLAPIEDSTLNKLYFDFKLIKNNPNIDLTNDNIGYLLRYKTNNKFIKIVDEDNYIAFGNSNQNKHTLQYLSGFNDNLDTTYTNQFNKTDNLQIATNSFTPVLKQNTNSRIIFNISELKQNNLTDITKYTLYMWNNSGNTNLTVKVNQNADFAWNLSECTASILDSNNIYFDFFNNKNTAPASNNNTIGFILKYNLSKIIEADQFLSYNITYLENQFKSTYLLSEKVNYSNNFQSKLLPFIMKGNPLLTYGDELGLSSNLNENRVPMRWIPKDIEMLLSKDIGNKFYDISKSKGQVLFDPFNNYSSEYNTNLERNNNIIPTPNNNMYQMMRRIGKLYNNHSVFNLKNTELKYNTKFEINIDYSPIITNYMPIEYIYNGNNPLNTNINNTKIKININDLIIDNILRKNNINASFNTFDTSFAVTLYPFYKTTGQTFTTWETGIQFSELIKTPNTSFLGDKRVYYFDINIQDKTRDLGYILRIKEISTNKIIKLSEFLNSPTDNFIPSYLLVNKFSYPEINIDNYVDANSKKYVNIRLNSYSKSANLNDFVIDSTLTVHLINSEYYYINNDFDQKEQQLKEYSTYNLLIQ